MNVPLFRWFRKLTTPILFQEEDKTRMAVVGHKMFALERALDSGQLHAFEYELFLGNETYHFEARL